MNKETIDNIHALLDGSMTSSEFDANLERGAFLRKCKATRFTDLEEQGLIVQAITVKEKAKKAIKLVRERGWSINKAAQHVGIAPNTVRDHATVTLQPKKEADKRMLATVLDYVNEQRMTLTTASRTMNESTTKIRRTIARCGHSYDVATKTIIQD